MEYVFYSIVHNALVNQFKDTNASGDPDAFAHALIGWLLNEYEKSKILGSWSHRMLLVEVIADNPPRFESPYQWSMGWLAALDRFRYLVETGNPGGTEWERERTRALIEYAPTKDQMNYATKILVRYLDLSVVLADQ